MTNESGLELEKKVVITICRNCSNFESSGLWITPFGDYTIGEDKCLSKDNKFTNFQSGREYSKSPKELNEDGHCKLYSRK